MNSILTRRKRSWNKFLSYDECFEKYNTFYFTIFCVFIGTLFCLIYQIYFTIKDPVQKYTSRQLLAVVPEYYLYSGGVCTIINGSEQATASWDTCVFEKSTDLPAIWIIFYVISILIIFIAEAVICDDFFVPSLEIISEKLHLSEDVAGATFMAAGSSSPELFSSMAAVTFDSDVGIGTITGSAAFNILVIISLSGVISKTIINLDWRPLTRDTIFYAFSIGWYIWSVYDTLIQWYDALGMLLIYGFYILIMVYNAKLMKSFTQCGQKCPCRIFSQVEPINDDMEHEMDGESTKASRCSIQHQDSITKLDSLGIKERQCEITINDQIINEDFDKSDIKKSMTRIDVEMIDSSKDNLNASNGTLKGKQFSAESSQCDSNIHFNLKEENEYMKTDDIKNENSVYKHDRRNSLIKVISMSDDKRLSLAVHPDTIKELNEEEEEEDDYDFPVIKCCHCCKACPPIRGAPPSYEDMKTEMENAGTGRFDKSNIKALYITKWIIFTIAFPFLLLFSYTIPDCTKSKNKKFFILSFFISVFWIAGISFAMVTIVSRLGCLINMDPFVMSLILLAIGSSIPDFISSLIVARDGYGNMAVSNAIGSNVFDINLGLGLPFFVRICINKCNPISLFSQKERKAWCNKQMQNMPHPKIGFVLIILLFIVYVLFMLSKFKLSRAVSVTLMMLYFLFLLYALIQEFVCSQGRPYIC